MAAPARQIQNQQRCGTFLGKHLKGRIDMVQLPFPRRRAVHALIALCAGLMAPFAMAAGPDATALIFDAPYLQNLKAPGRLLYRFETSSADPKTYGEDFTDEMQVKIDPAKDKSGSKDVTFVLFSGERQRSIGPVVDANANAGVMMMLEWDLLRMKRHVPGDASYFRNRVREAFRSKAAVEETKFAYDGKETTGFRITIKPYAEDPRASTLEVFRNKVYQFTVSDAVPGGIYQIRIFVPGEGETQLVKPMIDEKMTLVRYENGGAQ
jgi:hypothetical protein